MGVSSTSDVLANGSNALVSATFNAGYDKTRLGEPGGLCGYGRTIIGPKGWQSTWDFHCRLTDSTRPDVVWAGLDRHCRRPI